MTEVFIALDHVLLVADYSDPAYHAHLSKHLIISLREDITYKIEEHRIKGKGLMIGSDVRHTVESDDQEILVFLFDETSTVSRRMDEALFKERRYYELAEKQINQIIDLWRDYKKYQYKMQDSQRYSAFYESVLEVLNLNRSAAPKLELDERIKTVIKGAQSQQTITKETISWLAEEVYLSKSRLSHLFKEETGIALSSFLVNLRLMKTYIYVIEGQNITQAAILAGFNSSAHFSATNKHLYGIGAKTLQLSTKVYFVGRV